TVRATLATLADHPLEAPSVIVVGQVAAEDLNWFEGRPLFGRTVVVTRARAQASAFAHELRSLGASVIEAPTIEVVDPSDGGAALRAAVDELSSGTGAYDWLVVTSVNGVERTFDHLPDARVLAGVRVAAVGTATAEALAARRIVADLVPERFVAEGLIEAFPAPPPEGGRVLLARAEVARTELPDALRAMGWEVHDVAAYRTAPAAVADDVAERIAAADAVTFTSSSTVTNLVAAVGADRVPPVVASIGPVTTATARKLGLEVTVEATPHTTEALLAALVEALPPAVP
ncbi:MAG TPA: uroporphyrinogen-III synthase, partial [Acidimicrobiales bacterium]|nr:uroporphyrinogen-III synthase [Acidimicrobiales bacterium]